MWFDWRMIPVAFLIIGGLVATLAGALVLVISYFVPPPAPPPFHPGYLLLGGVISMAAGVGLQYLCHKYPDWMT